MDATLNRRLDRLRLSASRSAPSPAATRQGRAGRLAEVLGGGVVARDGSEIVVVDATFELSVDAHRLAALPYPFDAQRPLVCLDVETTGLGTAAGTLCFLVGIGTWTGGGHFGVRQLLLPDHADEAALLGQLAETLPRDAWLVTYNGVSFDWPLLVSRYRLHRRDPPSLAGQLDLLPVARGLWRHRLENARLATVEAGICGVVRHGDLPGALVPERYFGYLRSRRPELLRDVLDHNRQDIVSLGLLLSRLADGVADQACWPAAHPGDLGGLARAYLRRGRLVEALACVEAALAAAAWQRGVVGGGPLRRRLAAERARLLARLGHRAESTAAWLELARTGGPGAAAAWLHVARAREHFEHDFGAAIDACQAAVDLAQRARAFGYPLVSVERDLARRLPRLRRRAAARRAGSTARRAA
ncbi:MAG TPA: ribonuclease H-like domain-containing protein [Candidatus Limnocylindria bacterium]|nr:ribonuclease H-like domain-containing protein [Candidatus Limnocylindria bacterium]